MVVFGDFFVWFALQGSNYCRFQGVGTVFTVGGSVCVYSAGGFVSRLVREICATNAGASGSLSGGKNTFLSTFGLPNFVYYYHGAMANSRIVRLRSVMNGLFLYSIIIWSALVGVQVFFRDLYLEGSSSRVVGGAGGCEVVGAGITTGKGADFGVEDYDYRRSTGGVLDIQDLMVVDSANFASTDYREFANFVFVSRNYYGASGFFLNCYEVRSYATTAMVSCGIVYARPSFYVYLYIIPFRCCVEFIYRLGVLL